MKDFIEQLKAIILDCNGNPDAQDINECAKDLLEVIAYELQKERDKQAVVPENANVVERIHEMQIKTLNSIINWLREGLNFRPKITDRKTSDGTIASPNTAIGTSTLKAEGK